MIRVSVTCCKTVSAATKAVNKYVPVNLKGKPSFDLNPVQSSIIIN